MKQCLNLFQSIFLTLVDQIKELVSYRELLYSLVLRDIKIRYKQSFLGIAWAMFTPLAMMLIFTFVFSRITKISTGEIPYPIFAYCGLLPWTFFSGSLTGATVSLVSNRSLVTKIYFPREVFPLAAILSKFVDFCIALVILFGLMIYFRVSFHWTILLFPLLLVVQVLFMAGLAFFLSMGYLFYRDIKYIFDVIIMLWMFATSVIYPINVESPTLQRILMLNPMTPILDSYRSLILEGRIPNISSLSLPTVIAVAFFIIGWVWFHKSEYLFAETI